MTKPTIETILQVLGGKPSRDGESVEPAGATRS